MVAVIIVLIWLAVASPEVVYAQPPATIRDIVSVIGRIISFLAPAAGIAFFIMMLFGGYRFITSGGDPKSVAGARATLTYAILGIILVVSSWLIIKLIEQVTGVGVTTVSFP